MIGNECKVLNSKTSLLFMMRFFCCDGCFISLFKCVKVYKNHKLVELKIF